MDRHDKNGEDELDGPSVDELVSKTKEWTTTTAALVWRDGKDASLPVWRPGRSLAMDQLSRLMICGGRAGLHHPSSLEQHSPRRIRSLFRSQNKQTGSSSPLYTSRHVLIPAARPFRRRWPHPSCSSTASSYHARFEPRPKLFDWLTGFLLIYSTFFRRRTHPNGPCPRHSSQKIVISHLSLFIWHPPLLWHGGKLVPVTDFSTSQKFLKSPTVKRSALSNKSKCGWYIPI